MDVRQLELFLAAAEEGNFTRAAERAFITQPGMSSSIGALERELRVRLFDRGAGGASLTAAGQAFLSPARRIVADVSAAQQELADRARAGRPRSARVGTEQCMGDLVDIADLVTSFCAGQNKLDLVLEQAPSAVLLQHLRQGELDVALVARDAEDLGAPSLPDSHEVSLREEPFVVLTAPGQPLGETGRVGWDELESQPFVDFADTWAARQVLDRSFLRRDRRRHSAITVGDVHVLLDLVGHGVGVAVVPESVAAKDAAAHLQKLYIRDDVPHWTVLLVVAAHATATARAFASTFVPQGVIDKSRSELDLVLESVGAPVPARP
jgi:DNA-binding transcriptional LysR family regulator